MENIGRIGESRRPDAARLAAARAALGGPRFSFLGAGRITGVVIERRLAAGVVGPDRITVTDREEQMAAAPRCAAPTALGSAVMVLRTGRQPAELRQLVPATVVDESAVEEIFASTVRTICQGLREKESGLATNGAVTTAG